MANSGQIAETKIANTKKRLLDAVLSLSHVKDVNDITVSRLCQAAGINRTTFYRYYSIPADVLTEYCARLLTESLEVIYDRKDRQHDEQAPFDPNNIYRAVLDQCRIYLANRELLRLFYSGNASLSPAVLKQYLPASYDATPRSAAMAFLMGGYSNVIGWWVENEFVQTPEAIAAELTRCLLAVLPKET